MGSNAPHSIDVDSDVLEDSELLIDWGVNLLLLMMVYLLFIVFVCRGYNVVVIDGEG